MSRPIRKELNINSMVSVIGIPRKFVKATVKDLYGGSEERDKLVSFIKEYIADFENNLESCKGIFIYGSNGVGKTFISSILLKEAYKRRYSCKRISFMEYCSLYTRVWDASNLEERQSLEASLYEVKGAEFLVLEEIGKGVENSVTIPILEDLLRYREDNWYTTVIATNLSPKAVKEQYGKSIFSLITGNFTPVKIEDSDYRMSEYRER